VACRNPAPQGAKSAPKGRRIDKYSTRRRRYRVLVFDGVVLSRKSGVGALRQPVLVALGITWERSLEILDLAPLRATYWGTPLPGKVGLPAMASNPGSR
jgi:hypothetical protein